MQATRVYTAARHVTRDPSPEFFTLPYLLRYEYFLKTFILSSFLFPFSPRLTLEYLMIKVQGLFPLSPTIRLPFTFLLLQVIFHLTASLHKVESITTQQSLQILAIS